MKKLLLPFIILLTSIIFIIRLSYLQLYSTSANTLISDPAVRMVYDYPERGYIYDRNKKLLVANQPAYDVMFIPQEVKPLDTTEFCTLLKISKEDFITIYKKAAAYSKRLPSVFISQLSKTDYAMLQEKMRKYEGFYIQKRSLRHYLTRYGANVLGYVSEVNEHDIKEYTYYKPGEHIGKQGIEQQYETLLRGKKGVRYIQKDRFNSTIGPYKNSVFDTLPVKGKDIAITIDSELQAYGTRLMQNKRGGIVAIEPTSGEILALISAPDYDPSLLVGRERSKNYTMLYRDSIANPLYDRSLLAMYAPGSPFKILNALVGLQEEVINPLTAFVCKNAYYYGKRGRKMACHCRGGMHNLHTAIYTSCNTYFAQTYRRIIEKYPNAEKGLTQWEKHMKSFGLGDYLGYDLPNGKKGKIPDADIYTAMYGKNRWFATNTLSNAIGQGEILTTPIQLANITAIIANKGYYYTPHILKEITGKPITTKEFTVPKYTTIADKHFEPIIRGMFDVYNKGTAKWIGIPGISIAGKTGTAENFTKINGKRVQLTDHSIFIAFAPVEEPKIAIAVFVENGYWGNRWAGKIAGLLIEKYLRGDITRKDMETAVLKGSLENEYIKPWSGKPFTINQ